MSAKRKGKKETKLESPTQYKVMDPISLTDLEHMHTRKGKYPTKPPPFGQSTWEEAKREKEERLKRVRKEGSPSTPLETTSTDAMDTEEFSKEIVAKATQRELKRQEYTRYQQKRQQTMEYDFPKYPMDTEEFSKEIVAKATQRELKRQEYTRYQQKRQQTMEYDFPKFGTIPVPQLEKPREKREARTQSVLSNFEVPNYEEISMYSGKPSIMSRSVPTTPQQDKEKEVYGGARPKIPSTNKTAFQDYTSEMMKALNNPWNPKGRKTTTPVGAKIAPLVYLSLSGTSEEDQSTKRKARGEIVGINMPALDKTELVPDNLSQVKNPASPVKFTKEVINGAALKVEPKETSLLKKIRFEAQEEVNLEPDFYMPDGKGGKLSDTDCMYTTSNTPEGNPGVMVQLENLKEKYGTSIFLLDKRSGYIYVLKAGEYRKIEERGLLFPSESMIMAGALEREVGEPQPSMQISKMQTTPAAESTRIPLRTSTEKREKSLSSEQLLDLEKSEQYRQELKEAKENMLQACLEKSSLESQVAELIRFRALKAQKEFWDLERKREENRKTTEKMQEKIKELDQAVASSSKLMKELKGADTQYLAMGQAIADFWDTSDVPQDYMAGRIPSYPSLESLDQEYKEELSDIQYAYYNAKREVIMKKIDTAYEVYSAHLKEYEEADPKTKTQKYLLQYNDISNRLHGQFEVVTSMLGLPFKETLDSYPSLDSIMRIVEQEDLRDKGESFFEELLGEIEIKNAIAAKVYQNKSLKVTETGITKEFEEYKKESEKLIDFCKIMMDKRSKKEEYEELEQTQGVPDVKPISKEELDQEIKDAWITPKEAQNIGENTILPQYSREISRYEPPIPIKKKETEDLLEKVREITSGESKGSKDEKQV